MIEHEELKNLHENVQALKVQSLSKNDSNQQLQGVTKAMDFDDKVDEPVS